MAREETLSPVRLGELLHLPAIADCDLGRRLPGARTDSFDLLDHVVTLDDLSEDDVLAVEMRRCGSADEELRTIRVRSGIRHRKGAGAEMLAGLSLEGFVVELAAIDRLATGAVAASEVTTLAHKIRDHAMERRSFEAYFVPCLVLRADA